MLPKSLLVKENVPLRKWGASKYGHATYKLKAHAMVITNMNGSR